MPERCCCSLIEMTPGFSLPEVLPLLVPLAYRKPHPQLNRFSNRSYLQRVHARNCLAVRTHSASRCPAISPSRANTTTAPRPHNHCPCRITCPLLVEWCSEPRHRFAFFQKTSLGSRTSACRFSLRNQALRTLALSSLGAFSPVEHGTAYHPPTVVGAAV